MVVSWLVGMALSSSGQTFFLVGSEGTQSVERYNGTTGAFIDNFIPAGTGGLGAPEGIAQQPGNGAILVASYGTNQILAYDATTGVFDGVFATANISDPVALGIGPDGDLYVANRASDTVDRYNAFTGALIDTFVSTGDGGLSGPSGLAWGLDGNLYVTSRYTNQVMMYNGTTGAFDQVFIDVGGGLNSPLGLGQAANGNWYVSSFGGGTVGVFAGEGSALGSLPGNAPTGLTVGPDGKIYFTDYNTSTVSVFNTSTPSTPPVEFVGGVPGAPVSLAFVNVPEPGLAGLLAGGVAALLAVTRARRKRAGAVQSG